MSDSFQSKVSYGHFTCSNARDKAGDVSTRLLQKVLLASSSQWYEEVCGNIHAKSRDVCRRHREIVQVGKYVVNSAYACLILERAGAGYKNHRSSDADAPVEIVVYVYVWLWYGSVIS